MFDERPQTTATREATGRIGVINSDNDFDHAENIANMDLDDFKPD